MFRNKVASIGSTETAKNRVDRIWVLLAWFDASNAFGQESVICMIHQPLEKLAAFLGVGEAEQGTLAACTLDKRLDECLLMYIHSL